MSTDYYRPVKWISGLVVKYEGPHAYISIWNHGAFAGRLVIKKEDAQDALSLFCEPTAAAHVWCGSDRVHVDKDDRLSEGDVLISEYGEVTTLGKLLESIEAVRQAE